MSNRRSIQYVRLFMLIAVLALFAAPVPAQASVCTLADHIESANTNTAVGYCPAGGSHDVITITQDITLSEPLPPITGTITIEGGGHTISGAGQFRIFKVDGGQLTVSDLTLADGNAGLDSGGALKLQNDAKVTLENVTFTNNSARWGGAISARGEDLVLSVSKSRFQSNAARVGGAVLVYAGHIDISESSFDDNTSEDRGGAIGAYHGTLNVRNSSFTNNSALIGAGINISFAHATLTHITMRNNRASEDGNGLRNRSGIIRLRNSIIAGSNSASDHCAGQLAQNIGNLIEDWSCDSDFGGDPLLESGHDARLRDGSPAIDRADWRFCPAADQVGTERPKGGGCDIGAFESITGSQGPLPKPICDLANRIKSANTNTAVGGCPAGTSHDIITIVEDISLKKPLPPIRGTITIEGGGDTIDGAGKHRIFDVDGGNLTINNLTLRDGYSKDGGGAIRVRNAGRLTVNGSTFINNKSALFGGAIDLKGASRIAGVDGATFSHGAELTVNNSAFAENSSGFDGGALSLSGTTAISGSSFSNNVARQYGGAIDASGDTVSIANSTLNGNRAAWRGGAIYVGARNVTLAHLTMVNNSAASGGAGEALDIHDHLSSVRLRNSIIAGGGDDLCVGRLTENSGNLIQDGSCATAISGDPLLANLTGSPAYYPLLDFSPAVDAAAPVFCLDHDQLGTPRPQGKGCDIGAIESATAVALPTVVPAVCPLPDQIIAANTDTAVGNCPAGQGADTIHLIRDITLEAALPPVTSEITIDGNGYAISGDGRFRIFDVDGGALTLANMTLAEGNATNGGAIRLKNSARVKVSNVTFSDNSAGRGGAIATESSDVRLDVSESSFVGNKVEGSGGAILTEGGTVNITGSAFLDNGADREYGGAIETRAGTVAISNSTFSNNLAGLGGAIYISGAETTLTHLTLMNNVATQVRGAGIYKQAGAVYLRNSIIGGSGRGDDCYGRLDQSRGNLSQDGSCTAQITGDPLLAAMIGTSAHFPLTDASPAHGTADPAFCLATDQLGNPRLHCDIGAVETTRDANFTGQTDAALLAACTLTDQIIAANTDAPAGACPAGSGADTITLRGSIMLSEPLPIIRSDLTIVGGGHTINADNKFRVFDIESGTVTIKNMTLINGNRPGETGGAILARGNADVMVANVTFRNNRAGWGGGAASIDRSKLYVVWSSFFNNTAAERGGGIWFNSIGCYGFSDLLFSGSRSGNENPDPSREPQAPDMEFGPSVRCSQH